jgi:hypothetical protein
MKTLVWPVIFTLLLVPFVALIAAQTCTPEALASRPRWSDPPGDLSAPERPNFEHSRKVAVPSAGEAGQDFGYTIYIHNSGTADSVTGYMVDPLPEQVSINATTLSGPGTIATDTHQVTWRSAPADPLAAGQTTTITVQAHLDWGIACGTRLTNTATITDGQAASVVTIEAPLTVYRYGAVKEQWDLEADDGGFVAGSAGEWEWGPPDPAYTSGPRHAHSGQRVWGTDLDADARDSGDDHILTRTLNLPDDPTGIHLGWWDWFDEDDEYDVRYLLIDGTPAWSSGAAQPYWAFQTADLTAWAGETVELTFHLSTCCDDPGPAGWYIDDISLYADCPELELTPAQTRHACPGSSLVYPLTLKNATYEDDFISLDAEGGDWPVEVVPPELFLDPGESAPLTATVDIPWTVVGGAYDAIDITARTQNGWYNGALPIEAFASIGSGWDGLADTVGTRYHGLAYHDGSLYQIGGELFSPPIITPTDAVYRYDIATDSWTPRALLPTSLSGADGVAIGDRIYVPGGSDDTDMPFDGGTFLDSLHIYDPTANSWSLGASLPVSLAFASAVALDGKLYVMGGTLDDGSYSDALYIYDPTGDSWSQGASMSETRAYAGAGVINGQIYVAGGYAGGSVNRDSLEIYDPATGTWRAGPDLPALLASPGSGVVDDRYLVLASGDVMEIERYQCSREGWGFDVVTERWFPLPDLNRCLYGTALAGDGADLYLVSGRTNAGGWRMAAEVDKLTRCAAPPDAGWRKGVADVTWIPGLTRTIYAGDRLTVTDGITSAEAFTLSERWDPDHLTLVTYTLSPPSAGQVVPGGAWRMEPEAPFAYSRGDAEYSEVTSLVYFLGGRLSSGSDSPRVWAFDPRTGVYTDTGVNMPAAVTNYQIARLTDSGGREVLVIFGGYRESTGGFTDIVQGYYPDDGTTTLFVDDPLPVASIPGGVAVVDNKAYIFGGIDDASLLTATYIFDLTASAGSRWSNGPAMNRGRRYIPSGVVDGVIYALGGDVIGGLGLVAVTTTEKLDTSAGVLAWDEAGVAPMPIACDEAPAFGFDTTDSHALAGSVVIAGCGHWSNESGLSLRYDAVRDQWDTGFPSLNLARRNHAGALVPSTDGVSGMWVWGGRQINDSNILDEPERYTIGALTWTVSGGASDEVAMTKHLTVISSTWIETDLEETVWIQGRVYEHRLVSFINGDRSFIYLPLVMRDS